MTIEEAREILEDMRGEFEEMNRSVLANWLENGGESVTAIDTLLTDHARLVERNRILEDVRLHYADEERWYCSAVHIHKVDDPECLADSYNGGGNGFDYARQADEQLEDLNGK